MKAKKYFNIATQYAEDVISGKITASDDVINACKRFQEDLTRDDIIVDTRQADAVVSIMEGIFVHRNGELLGIGRASGEKIDLVIAAKRGAGFDVMCALRHALSADTAVLEVASVNEKAIRLYSRMGFVPSKELSRWYQVR